MKYNIIYLTRQIRLRMTPNKLSLLSLGLFALSFFILSTGLFTVIQAGITIALVWFVFLSAVLKTRYHYLTLVPLGLAVFFALLYYTALLELLIAYSSGTVIGGDVQSIATQVRAIMNTPVVPDYWILALRSRLGLSVVKTAPTPLDVTMSTGSVNFGAMAWLIIPLVTGVIVRTLDIEYGDDIVQLLIFSMLLVPVISVAYWSANAVNFVGTYSQFVSQYGEPFIPFYTSFFGEMCFNLTRLVGELGIIIAAGFGALFPTLMIGLAATIVAFVARYEEPFEEEEEAELGDDDDMER